MMTKTKHSLRLEAVKVVISYYLTLVTLSGSAFIGLVAYFWLNINQLGGTFERFSIGIAVIFLILIFYGSTVYIFNHAKKIGKGDL